MTTTIHQFAPAKINLSLQIIGKRDDGFHLLDSLVVFADIGDDIIVTPAENYQLSLNGPFGGELQAEDNLITRGVRILEEITGRQADVHLTLTKNLPVGSGIGGGSSDAAAAIIALLQHWDISFPFEELRPHLTRLGADVPVCYAGRPAHIIGIGDAFEEMPTPPSLPILLVNPLTPCSTKEVFSYISARKQDILPVPSSLDKQSLFAYLDKTTNEMTEAACNIVPAIKDILDELHQLSGVRLARMSGSGATCFALFEDDQTCAASETTLKQNRPHWWVRTGHLLP